MPVARATFIASLYGAGSMLAGPLGGAFADRIGRRATMVLGLSLGGVMMVVVAFLRNPAALPFATFGLGLVVDCLWLGAVAAVAHLGIAPRRRRRSFELRSGAAD